MIGILLPTIVLPDVFSLEVIPRSLRVAISRVCCQVPRLPFATNSPVSRHSVITVQPQICIYHR
jgi:hypothetical protein